MLKRKNSFGSMVSVFFLNLLQECGRW